MEEHQNILTLRSECISQALQMTRSNIKWMSSFISEYHPLLGGERYLTDKELSSILQVSKRTLQEYRNKRINPFYILFGKALYPETEILKLLERNYQKPL